MSRLGLRLKVGVPAAVFLACLGVYLHTLNPAFRADDSPETTAAAYTLGIQHPPGYPLHTLLARSFMLDPLGAPAWRGNLFAAFCGALACALLAFLAASLARQWLRSQGEPDGTQRAWLGAAVGTAAGLLLGLGTTFWPQSLAAKGGIYTLHLAFMAGSLALLWAWGRDADARPQDDVAALLRLPTARLLVLVLALGMGNHWETQALVLPAVALFVGLTLWPRRKALGAWRASALPLAGLGVLGVAVYAYLPLRARLDPVLNWGDPKDWGQFWWVFLRQEYLDLETGFLKSLGAFVSGKAPWSAVVENWAYVQRQGLRVLGHLLGPRADLGAPCAALSVLGLWAWRPGRDSLAARFSAALAALALGFVAVITFYFHLKPEMIWILDVFLLPAYLAQAVFAAMGGLWLWRRAGAPLAARPWAALALAALLLPALVAARAPRLSQARQYLAWDYGLDLLLSVRPNGIVLAEGDFNTMPIYYLQHVAGFRKDVDHVTTVFFSTDWGVEHARGVQPRLKLGAVPKSITGARAGDAQVLRAALGSMAAANLPQRPLHASLFRQELARSVPEWEPLWRPWGLAPQIHGAASDASRLGLLKALRSRHLELDRERLDPSPSFALSNYGTAFMDLANSLRNQGRLDEALPLYTQAVAWTSRDNRAEAYTHWGIALGSGAPGHKPDLGAAAQKFEQALAIKPLYEAYANLAGVRNQQGQLSQRAADFAAAEAAARQALALQPNAAPAFNNLAIALYYQGKATEAVSVLRQAAALAPNDAQIQANLRALSPR